MSRVRARRAGRPASGSHDLGCDPDRTSRVRPRHARVQRARGRRGSDRRPGPRERNLQREIANQLRRDDGRRTRRQRVVVRGPNVQGAVVSVGVRPLGPAGSYTVNYRVTSADGHPVSGSWGFRLTVSGTGTPGPSAAPSDAGDNVPVWPFVAITVAAVGAAALWEVRRRR